MRSSFLDDEVTEHYREYGYVHLKNLLPPSSVLDPLEAELEAILSRVGRELYVSGRISAPPEGRGLGGRLEHIFSATGDLHVQAFDCALPQSGVTLDTPFSTGAALLAALTCAPLLDAAERFVGPEITSAPMQHVRIKLPERLRGGHAAGGPTPWHQDAAGLLPRADDTHMITVWFPLQDVRSDSGCLQVVPGSHQGGVVRHCVRDSGPGTRGLHIPERLFEVERAVPVPMRRGDVLIFHRFLIHSSMENHSDVSRWSVDFRLIPTGQWFGREQLPRFVARSRSCPSDELRDAEVWSGMWLDARRRLARGQPIRWHRWSSDDPGCA